MGHGNKKPHSVTGDNLEELLGESMFRHESARCGVGVVNGIVWIAVGGATPKDEPNAGMTMVTALVSLALSMRLLASSP